MPFPSDLQIALAAPLKPLADIAGAMGIGGHLLEPYGDSVAKVKLAALEELADRPRAKYILISAVTPTPLGEGKTTTAIGLADAFSHIGRSATPALRQPSMGPTRAATAPTWVELSCGMATSRAAEDRPVSHDVVARVLECVL